jgi:site-specific DNA-methyltransferase (adenine-specific)
MSAVLTETLPINSIVCGDNVDLMSTFPKECIDLVVTSPPYDELRTYNGHSWDFEAVAQQLWRIIKPGGVVVWVVGDAMFEGSETGTSFRQALRFKEIGFRLHDTMIYAKGSCQFPETVRYYQQMEYMFVLSKGRPIAINLIADKKNNYAGTKVSGTERCKDGSLKQMCGVAVGRVYKDYGVRSNVWTYRIGCSHTSGEHYAHKHPAIFPEALARDHIRSWSNEGDIVLDPFSGSGTTAKVARLLGRKYIGLEISEEYCEIARKRLSQKLLEFESEEEET